MESPPPIARYTLQQSMKRVFTGSSASYMDPEVVEIPPPVSWRSNSKSIKRKEVIHREVIDIDMDEDSVDLMLIDDKVDTQEKGKGFFRSKKKPAIFSSATNYASNNQLEAMKLSAGVESSFGGSYPFSKRKKPVGNSYKSASTAGSSTTSNIEKNSEENGILKKFQDFKQFDIVQDYSDHHYSSKGSTAYQPSKAWAKKIQDEWRILEKDLPDAIFVRVYESRMDLLRAVIVGAEGTPYHDGLFFFDVFFPCSYPKVPPHVYYHSGGLRINPNLYDCGKVCLSLLNTWSGGQKEKWIPGVSTMLQVLVSIQALILNQKPYFNEPAYAGMSGSASGEKSSQQYNENTFILSLKTMVYTMKRPPKHFEDFAVGHFYKHAQDILVACKAYLDGAQVGCLAKGGVQDVDEGDQSCSQNFKNTLAGSITMLVKSFSKVGAKDSEKFLSLSLARNINSQVPAIPTASNYYF